MHGSPLDHKRVCAARQRSIDDIQSCDVVLCFVLAVERMKVRWGMIVPIHSNEDSEEFADGGHVGVLGRVTAGFQLSGELSL